MRLLRAIHNFFEFLIRVILSPLYWLYFRFHQFPWDNSWHIFGFPVLSRARGSDILIGKRLYLRSRTASNTIGVTQPVILRTIKPDAKLHLGSDIGASGCSIIAAKEITVQDHVLIGSGALIIDSDLHPLDPDLRLKAPDVFECAPVRIEANSFIGARAIILKGVVIGEGAVVGAGAVVVHDVDPYTIVAGNPARKVKDLK